jgi:hypothetical protein
LEKTGLEEFPSELLRIKKFSRGQIRTFAQSYAIFGFAIHDWYWSFGLLHQKRLSTVAMTDTANMMGAFIL